ncbi:MAG TPA: hypothetical protein VH025_04200 [Solirubrobacteraceae bacterium]|jgi:hypothetical protein|nr:hypothetical protein [Solirubrobacteraceae bacterium]
MQDFDANEDVPRLPASGEGDDASQSGSTPPAGASRARQLAGMRPLARRSDRGTRVVIASMPIRNPSNRTNCPVQWRECTPEASIRRRRASRPRGFGRPLGPSS